MNAYFKTTIQGYTVSVITTANGKQLFVRDAEGFQVYAHRVSGDPIARAKEVIREAKS